MSPLEAPRADPPPPRRRRWRWTLSLRALMGLVLVIGGALGWAVQRERVRRSALATIVASDGSVGFRDEQTPEEGWRGWLHRRFGLESCREVASVTLNSTPPPPPGKGPLTITTTVTVADASGPVGPPPPPRVELFAAVGRLGAVGSLTVTGGSTTPAELAALAEDSVVELTLFQPWEVSAEAVAALARLGTLRSLQVFVPRVDLSADAIAAIGRLGTLREVDLTRNAPLTSADLAPLGQLRDLEELRLSTATTDDAFLDALSGCRHLQVLQLGGTEVSDDRLRRLVAGAPDLAAIGCDGSRLTDAGVAALGGLAGLKSCQLFGDPAHPPRLTDASLVALGRCRSLSILMLPPGRYTDAGLTALGGLPFWSLQLGGSVESCSATTLTRLVAGRTFTALTLPGPAIDDTLVPILAGHFNPKVGGLTLDHARITDAAAHDLLKVPVFSLSLADTALGDAGLATLASHPTLGGLNAVNTRITPEGAAAFRRAPSGIKLSYEDPASAQP